MDVMIRAQYRTRKNDCWLDQPQRGSSALFLPLCIYVVYFWMHHFFDLRCIGVTSWRAQHKSNLTEA